MQSLHKCQHCLKEFKKQGYYKKHISLCEIISGREKDATFDIDFSNDQLVGLIKHLIQKQTAMENELASLKRIVNRSKNKLTILDWINDNYENHDEFNTWFQSINVDNKDLQVVFNSDLVDGIYQIITSQLNIENDTSPLLSFVQKPNVLYMYHDKKWSVMTSTHFESCVNDINEKIIKQFKLWQDDHQFELSNNKYGEDYYPSIVNKIMGGTQSRATLYSKIRSKLYHHNKINLKDVMMNDDYK